MYQSLFQEMQTVQAENLLLALKSLKIRSMKL